MPCSRLSLALVLGGALTALLSPRSASAQFTPGVPSFAANSFSCTPLVECTSPTICGVGARCSDLLPPPVGTAAVGRCTAVTPVFCCQSEADCPVQAGSVGRCVQVLDPQGGMTGRAGICVYPRLNYCLDGNATTLPRDAVAKCVRLLPTPQSGGVFSYEQGDCDQDTLTNNVDPCPCDSANRCVPADAGAPSDAAVAIRDAALPRDAGPPDTSAPVDLGNNGARDASTRDATSAPGDAAAGDAGTAAADAGSSVPEDAGSEEDAGGVTPGDAGAGTPQDAGAVAPFDADPARGLEFRGAGGCACRVRNGDAASLPLALGALAGALALRRLARTRPKR